MKQKILHFVDRNKIYVGIVFFFLIWMLFFDEYNWIRIRRDTLKLRALKREAAYLQEKIKSDKDRLHELKSNPLELEKYARETYFMKKDNEDIYVIVEK
jgi:cell division protein DivIC